MMQEKLIEPNIITRIDAGAAPAERIDEIVKDLKLL
jgi:hypothetical protein